MLEAYLDGDLPARRAARVRGHLEGCFGCRTELAHAERVRGALRALPPQRFPESAWAEVRRRVGAPALAQAAVPTARRPRAGSSWRRWLPSWSLPVWRPALVSAGVVAAVVAMMVMARPRPRPVSEAELAQAEVQIRWVMAHLGEIGRRTGMTVRDEVLEARVVEPTTQAVERALAPERVQ
jgi:anti-sigma factor RsiW